MKTILALCAVGLTTGGCAKLPLDNSAPTAPLLDSDGVYSGLGVAVQVLVDDPDGDRVALHFQAFTDGSPVLDFAWTSFIPSGEEEVFYLNLNPGSWTLMAWARDEWDELSPQRSVTLVVAYP